MKDLSAFTVKQKLTKNSIRTLESKVDPLDINLLLTSFSLYPKVPAWKLPINVEGGSR